MPRGEPFQDAAAQFLQFAEARQVVLEIVVQQLCLVCVQFRSQNHVAQFYRVREQRVFLELFQGQIRIVVIHGSLNGRQMERTNPLYWTPRTRNRNDSRNRAIGRRLTPRWRSRE